MQSLYAVRAALSRRLHSTRASRPIAVKSPICYNQAEGWASGVKGATMTIPILERSTENRWVEQLPRSPRLPVVAEQLGALVTDETVRRQRFVDTVSESEKAEFIDGKKVAAA